MLDLFLQGVSGYSGEPPSWFTYTAIGWAVSLTTGIGAAVLTGKLCLAREVLAAVASGDEQSALYKSLYEEEKGRRLKVQEALDATVDDLRLQNRTLATTVQALQQVARSGSTTT